VIDRLIIHCSATRRDQVVTVADIRRWHVDDNGWSDVGYHGVLHRDGRLEPGRSLSRMGAHVRGHNRGTLGLCLIGGHGSASTDKFMDHFTEAQRAQLATLCIWAQQATMTVHGHNEYAAKACPGFDVQEFLKGDVK